MYDTGTREPPLGVLVVAGDDEAIGFFGLSKRISDPGIHTAHDAE
jgi:hypothetical protein